MDKYEKKDLKQRQRAARAALGGSNLFLQRLNELQTDAEKKALLRSFAHVDDRYDYQQALWDLKSGYPGIDGLKNVRKSLLLEYSHNSQTSHYSYGAASYAVAGMVSFYLSHILCLFGVCGTSPRLWFRIMIGIVCVALAAIGLELYRKITYKTDEQKLNKDERYHAAVLAAEHQEQEFEKKKELLISDDLADDYLNWLASVNNPQEAKHSPVDDEKL